MLFKEIFFLRRKKWLSRSGKVGSLFVVPQGFPGHNCSDGKQKCCRGEDSPGEDSPGEWEQQLFPFTWNGIGTVRGHWNFPKANFQPCPFFSVSNTVHAPLLNTNHQHMTEDWRTRSAETELSPILPGCSTLYPVLQVMVNESSNPASLDGRTPWRHSNRENVLLSLQNSDLKSFTNSTTTYIPSLNY